MKIGFTGTREGMTDNQKSAFGTWLYDQFFYGPQTMTEFHHGACVGADELAANIIHEESPMPRPVIHAHSSNLKGMTSDLAMKVSAVKHPAKPPLDRNRDIVDTCEVLVACPKGPEEMRSGTWATVRYARKRGRRVVIFWPDGKVTKEGESTQ